MHRERTKKSHTDSRIGPRTRFWTLLLCTNVIVGIMLAVVLGIQRRDTGDSWNRMLSAVADEKASALSGDIEQQLGNVVVLAHARSASQLGLGQTPVAIPGEPALKDRLLNIFESARSNYGYSQVMLTTSQGVPIVALPDAQHVIPHLEEFVLTALATGKPQFIDVFLDGDGHVLVGYVSPVFDPSGTPAGGIVALADPKMTLFRTLTIAAPLMDTGETIVLRRSTADQDASTGIEIIYTPDLALPVGDTGIQVLNTPKFFSSAIQGTLSPGLYVDPQGQSMMGVARPIQSAGWVIVAGVSVKEALGDFVRTGILESVLSFVVASAAFAVLNMLSIDREKRLLRLTANELETQNSDIARLNQLLTATREVNQLMSHGMEPPELLDRVCLQLVETCGFPSAWIILLEGSSLRLGAEAGVPLGMLSSPVPVETAGLRAACFVAAIRERRVIYGALHDNDLCITCQSRTGCPSGEMLVAPVVADSKVYGVLVVRSGKAGTIGTEERNSMEGLANDVAFAMSLQTIRREKQVAEDSLLQAQKMEAVGQLAGGVAHDFNNLLTGIAGNIDLALDDIPVGSETARSLTDAMKAAHKAGELTRSLLTFSRKAMIAPTVADVNKIIDEVLTLLARSLPPSIRIARHPSIDVWPVRVDTSQIAQVLVNLAINARDAMHGAGTLTITAANQYVGDHVEIAGEERVPGEFVAVTVSDTGEGMTAEVQKHLFEPFFTTKDVGQGTGLGLSIAYGAVKQAGGWIDVQSESGQGSSLTVYLPRCKQHPSKNQEPTAGSQELPKGTETILMVDDEESVRTLGKRILERFGYTVLSAASGAEACELFEKHHDTIDLVICDLTMPGMSGIDCVARLKRINPKALVLLSSGYTAEVAELSLLTRGPGAVVEFLAKPYTVQEMVTMVRRVLDASDSAGSAARRQRQPDAPH